MQSHWCLLVHSFPEDAHFCNKKSLNTFLLAANILKFCVKVNSHGFISSVEGNMDTVINIIRSNHITKTCPCNIQRFLKL